jgi:hypothetical protein
MADSEVATTLSRATLNKTHMGDTIYTRDLFSKKEDDEPLLDTQTKLGMRLSILRAAGVVSKEEEDPPYEGDDQGPTPEWWKKRNRRNTSTKSWMYIKKSYHT